MMEKLDSKLLAAVVLDKSNEIEGFPWKRFAWEEALKKASHNRVLYVFSKNLLKYDHLLSSKQKSDLKKIIAAGNAKMAAFRRTVGFLNRSIGKAKIPFLIVKTFKSLDYVTFDVDVLVPYRDFFETQKSLKRAGCKISTPRERGLHQRNCQKEGLLNIDLHRKFYWKGLDPIDLDFVWQKPEKKLINGIECLCPSPEVDFLLHNKHLIHERGYITFLDFWAVKSLYEMRNLNMVVVEEQVEKYGWKESYRHLLRYLSDINFCLFNKKLFKEVPAESRDSLELPFIFPYFEIIGQYFDIARNHKTIPLFDLAYYHFVFGRYYLSGKQIMPYYLHWFDFNKL